MNRSVRFYVWFCYFFLVQATVSTTKKNTPTLAKYGSFTLFDRTASSPVWQFTMSLSLAIWIFLTSEEIRSAQHSYNKWADVHGYGDEYARFTQ